MIRMAQISSDESDDPDPCNAMVSRSVSRSLGHLDKVVLVLVQAQHCQQVGAEN
jgi:hypothetical protein